MLCFHSLKSQIVFVDAPYDMGVITAAGSDYLDIPVKNIGKEKAYIFRSDVDKRFQIHYSSKTIYPDSTVYIRVLFYPDKKGAFHEKFDIHFSNYDKPQTLHFSGFVDELPMAQNISCPSFSQQNANTTPEFDFTIKVIDADTRELLPKSQIKVIQNGLLSETLDTQKKGYVTKKNPLGYYYFIAENENYLPNELGTYVNRKNNIVIIPLKKREIIIEEEELISATVSEEILEEEEEIVYIIPNEEKETTTKILEEIKEEETPLEEIKDETKINNANDADFSLAEYKPNNIVFLVDISSSMNREGKLDLLKASMIELTKILRPEDKITMVSYASNANIILETTSGAYKDSVISIIQNLKAQGMTDGAKGLEKAYEQAELNYLIDGNNQVFMATDGALNFEDNTTYKMAKKFSKKGVNISIIGIKNKTSHIPLMIELAIKGKGDFIDIQTYAQAQNNLVEIVKKQSKRLP